MAQVDPQDDSIERFIVRHYRYGPQWHERRHVAASSGPPLRLHAGRATMGRMPDDGGRLIVSVDHPFAENLWHREAGLEPDYFATYSYCTEWTVDGQSAVLRFRLPAVLPVLRPPGRLTAVADEQGARMYCGRKLMWSCWPRSGSES